MKQIANLLQILWDKVQELQHKPLDILHTTASDQVALPVNETLLNPAKIVWQISGTASPTCKRADKMYYIPAQNSEFLFLHPSPNSFVGEAINEHSRQHHTKSTRYDKDLNLFGHKN